MPDMVPSLPALPSLPAPCLTRGPLSPCQPSEELIRAVLEAFRDPARAREHGLQFNGASYSCVRADQWAVYAKKVRLQSVLALDIREVM